ncbi:MAG: hypothetical protein KIH67_001200 [Candidatus Moranbacteria bacterium]|nr:hypothetical protein [Candidatus Moranbacteria bacterium]
MYWIYLILFIFVILTPELIGHGTWFLSEDDLESLIIFAFGTLGLLLYVSKEKAFFRVREEKVSLQKKTNTISKDLSQSYSYIGEMNRKLDVIQDVIFELPKKSSVRKKRHTDIYKPILEAAKVFARTEKIAFHVVDTATKETLESSGRSYFKHCTAEYLLKTKKSFWVEEKCIVARSPQSADGKHAFLILGKETNHVEDMEMLQLLASEGLLLAVLTKPKTKE